MAEHQFRDSYLAATLTFEDDKITWYCPEMKDVREVMMSWEQPIMTKMAEVAVSEGDHVLECGFGMGILSDAVQARNPASHTIVECHPQIIVKLNEWAADKPNVNVIEGKWFDQISEPQKYDAILMDTYVDDDLHPSFAGFCERKAKDNCKVSWWNFSGGTTDEFMKFYWNNVSFTEVTGLNPPENTYYNRDNYFIPLKILNQKARTYGILDTSTVHISETETKNIFKINTDQDILTCEDPSNPNLIVKTGVLSYGAKCKGVYNINDGLLIVTGNHPMIIKRNGSWIEKNMNELVVGDKLYKVDNTEVEITSINFDSSETIYTMVRLNSNDNYFVNNMLIKNGGKDA
tara:strand:+ start:3018 stop:4058 length:1041 start_codon:yes stop_codon:yes gene_type:complete